MLPTRGGPINDELAAFVERVMKHVHCPSLSISWSDSNGAVATGFGYARFPDLKADGNSVYGGASTTKAFTAMSVMMALEDSVHHSEPKSLQTTMKKILGDDFELKDQQASTKATLEDLLVHRTGMPGHDASYGGPNSNPAEVTRHLRYLSPAADTKFREKSMYNNMMYVAVSHAIEVLTGSWLGSFLKERIWDPLGMHSTFFRAEDALKAEAEGKVGVARPYWWNDNTQAYEEQAFMTGDELSGDGAILTSVSDYALFLRAMLEENPALVSKESYRELRTPRMDTDDGYSYALGWVCHTYHGVEVIQHDGSIQGFDSLMLYVPAHNWTLALVGSADGRAYAAIVAISFRILDNMLGVPENERKDHIKMWEDEQAAAFADWDNAREDLYPDAPPPNLARPPTIELESFAGTYHSDGYQSVTLLTQNSPDWWLRPKELVLHADNFERQNKQTLDFEHVDGDDFIARGFYPPFMKSYEDEKKEYYKARFKVEDRKAIALGIDYEEAAGDLIWFERSK